MIDQDYINQVAQNTDNETLKDLIINNATVQLCTWLDVNDAVRLDAAGIKWYEECDQAVITGKAHDIIEALSERDPEDFPTYYEVL